MSVINVGEISISQWNKKIPFFFADDRPWACSQCPARFKHKSSLTTHTNTHMKKTLYKCDWQDPECLYETYDMWRYKAHLKAHKQRWVLEKPTVTRIRFLVPWFLWFPFWGTTVVVRTAAHNRLVTCSASYVYTYCIYHQFCFISHNFRLEPKVKIRCEICGAMIGKFSMPSHMKIHSSEGMCF